MSSDSAGKIFLCPRPACPLLSACPLNYNLFAEQLLEFLTGAHHDSIPEGGLGYKRCPPRFFLF